jgi:hypothetical protein
MQTYSRPPNALAEQRNLAVLADVARSFTVNSRNAPLSINWVLSYVVAFPKRCLTKAAFGQAVELQWSRRYRPASGSLPASDHPCQPRYDILRPQSFLLVSYSPLFVLMALSRSDYRLHRHSAAPPAHCISGQASAPSHKWCETTCAASVVGAINKLSGGPGNHSTAF